MGYPVGHEIWKNLSDNKHDDELIVSPALENVREFRLTSYDEAWGACAAITNNNELYIWGHFIYSDENGPELINKGNTKDIQEEPVKVMDNVDHFVGGEYDGSQWSEINGWKTFVTIDGKKYKWVKEDDANPNSSYVIKEK